MTERVHVSWCRGQGKDPRFEFCRRPPHALAEIPGSFGGIERSTLAEAGDVAREMLRMRAAHAVEGSEPCS